MTTIRIDRTGKQALTFVGDAVARSLGATESSDNGNPIRYHNLTLWRTDGGAYVLEIEYVTMWRGELGYRQAEIVEPGEVAARLAGYDPCAHVQGFPPLTTYAARQRNLLSWIRRRYEAQVGELLAKVGELDEVVR